MLYFDRIDVSEGIHVNKTRVSKECHIECIKRVYQVYQKGIKRV